MKAAASLSLQQAQDVIACMFNAHQAYMDQHGNPPKDQATAYLVGEPGVGKTSILRQLAKQLEETHKQPIAIMDLRLATVEPVDLRGILVPNETTRTAEWYPPSNLPNEEAHGVMGILFVDELNKTIPMNLNAIANLLYDREIGEYKLPDRWMVVAAGNNMSDKAGDMKLPTHLANRLMQIGVKPDVKEWLKWAEKADIHPAVRFYIEKVPAMLQAFDSKATASPTCRSWQFVSDIMHMKFEEASERVAIAGAVGPEAMTGFMSSLRQALNIPMYADIINAPKKCSIPKEESERFATAKMMGEYVRDDALEDCLTYLERMKAKEYTMHFLSAAIEKSPEIRKSEIFRDYIAKHNINALDL